MNRVCVGQTNNNKRKLTQLTSPKLVNRHNYVTKLVLRTYRGDGLIEFFV